MKISKKLFVLASAFTVVLFTSTMFADGYSLLKFSMENGETYTVEAQNLEFTISSENLTFNNSDLSLPVSSLVSMEFTDHYTGTSEVNEIPANLSGKIEIYTLDGLRIGEFNSCSESLPSLMKGIYVIKDTKGNSFKISVGK